MLDRKSMSDRELLIRIDERGEAMEKRVDNHGHRIKILEKGFWMAAGGLIIIGGWIKAKVTGSH